MTYRELQKALKTLRNNGSKLHCKLNAKKIILQSEYDRLTVVPSAKEFAASSELVNKTKSYILSRTVRQERSEALEFLKQSLPYCTAISLVYGDWEKVLNDINRGRADIDMVVKSLEHLKGCNFLHPSSIERDIQLYSSIKVS